MTIFYVHSVSGDNGNDGLSWETPWRTTYNKQGDIDSGDTILISKTEENALPGTATTTYDSLIVSTTEDLTPSLSATACIRFDDERTVYFVGSITSTTITLKIPYSGSSGSGKTIKKFEKPAGEPDLWNYLSTPSWTDPTGRVTMIFGVNPATNEQDGYTLLYFASVSQGFRGSYRWNHDISGFVSFTIAGNSYPFWYWYRANFTDVHGWAFYTERTSFILHSRYCNVYNSTFAGRIDTSHLSSFYNCRIRVGEIYESGHLTFYNCYLYNPSSGMYYSYYARGIMTFINCVIDMPYIFYPGAPYDLNLQGGAFFRYCEFRNLVSIFGGSSRVYFNVFVEHYNKEENNNQVWFCLGDAAALSYRQYNDGDVFRTSRYSIRIEGQGSQYTLTTLPIYIPGKKGGTYSVSAWMRKNSYWGGDVQGYSALPIMRLRHATGTTGDGMIRHNSEVTMDDVNDEWVQLSVSAAEHNFDTAMILEFDLMSANTSAAVWIDDVEVMEI